MPKTYCAYDLSRKRFMTERHKKRIMNKAKGYQGYCYQDERYIGGKFVPVAKPYCRRFYRSSYPFATQLKRYHNKSLRNDKNAEYANGSYYKKLREYWWNID